MASQSRAILKSFFEKGDKPTQANFTDVFDSALNLKDGGTIIGSTTFTSAITASIISASGTIFADNFQSTGGDIDGIKFTDNINLTGDLTSSGNISSSGTVSSSGLNVKGCSSEVYGFLGASTLGNMTTISSCTTVLENYNAVLWVSNYNPSITVSQGVEYSINVGADVLITNMMRSHIGKELTII